METGPPDREAAASIGNGVLMSNVWISKESWERLWHAMHNVQIRFSRLVSHPSGGITGDGLAAQFRIDLPERPQESPRQWRYEVNDLGNDSWRIQFYSDGIPNKAGKVHYRGTYYEIASTDCSFVLTKADLTASNHGVYFVLVKQANINHPEGVTFVPRLTRMTVSSSGTGFLSEQCIQIANFMFDQSKNHPVIYVYQDQTIEWYDPYFQNNQLRLDVAFGPTPASNNGFAEFLDGALQYLLVDQHLSMMVNGFPVTLISEFPKYEMIPIDENNPSGKSWLYVYFACDISTPAPSQYQTNLPIDPRIEIRDAKVSDPTYQRYRNVDIPIMCLLRQSYPISCEAAQSGIYEVYDNFPYNIPAYWVNTCGLDFDPEKYDGWITIDFKRKKVVINGIRCYCDNVLRGTILRQTLDYESTMPISGSMTVNCVYDADNDRWGTPYLKCGGQQITEDTSGVTGTLLSVEIASISSINPETTAIRQNYSGPARLSSYTVRINRLQTQLNQLTNRLNDEISARQGAITQVNNRISSYHT